MTAHLDRHAAFADQPRLHVAITGASGLVGAALSAFLVAGGHRVTPLVRGKPGPGEARWSPVDGALDADRLAGVDAVVHLAGESIAGGQWTDARMARIRDSRIHGTRALCEALARLPRPPRTLVSASAIGFYGDRGDHVLVEESPQGTSFLADVCRGWEDATGAARHAGARVVRLRIGVVMSAAGGALRTMLPLFKLGLGGRLGSGTQWVSWIARDDLVGAIHHALMTDLEGPVNATAPHPVTNAELTRVLAGVLHRPAVLPAPAFALRLALGRKMADETLLCSARVLPRRLTSRGFRFLCPTLEEALRAELGKAAPALEEASP